VNAVCACLSVFCIGVCVCVSVSVCVIATKGWGGGGGGGGQLLEVFGAGTAAIVSPVKGIFYEGSVRHHRESVRVCV
jgi:hypothetical protein